MQQLGLLLEVLQTVSREGGGDKKTKRRMGVISIMARRVKRHRRKSRRRRRRKQRGGLAIPFQSIASLAGSAIKTLGKKLLRKGVGRVAKGVLAAGGNAAKNAVLREIKNMTNNTDNPSTPMPPPPTRHPALRSYRKR